MLSDNYRKNIYIFQALITTLGISIIGLLILINQWGDIKWY